MSDMITEYNQIYAELCDLIGKDNMYIIYQHFKGMQVSFPSKLYSKEYVVSQIAWMIVGLFAVSLIAIEGTMDVIINN